MRNVIKLIMQRTLFFVLAASAWSYAIAQGAAGQDPNLTFSSNGTHQIIDNEVTLYWGNIPYQYGFSATGHFITSNPLVPYVVLYRQQSNGGKNQEECDYLGFVEGMGSLLRCYKNTGDITGVYVYNGSAHSLVKRYADLDEIPSEVISSLQNKRYLYVSQKDRTNPVGSVSANANPSVPVHYVVKPQESDPNFPAGANGDPSSQKGLPLQWRLAATQPAVTFYTREVADPNAMYLGQVEGLYLGFNKQGSWVASGSNGKVYIWNAGSRTLEAGANSWWEVPLDLSNPSPLMQAIIFYDQHSRTAGNSDQVQDPNFPPTLANLQRAEMPVVWNGRNPPDPRDISFSNSILHNAWYLGFNERGSWLMAGLENKVYIWSFKTLGVSEAAIRLENVPVNVLVSLRDKSEMTKGVIARLTGHGSDGVKAANTSGRTTPYIPPSVAGDGNAQYSNSAKPAKISSPNSNSASPAAPATQLTGSGAHVNAGALTFTLNDPGSPDNGKQVSYKVMRSSNPAMMNNPNAPAPSGMAGTWIADDPNNKDGIILFVVKDEGTVVGTMQSGMVAQAMKRMMMGSPHP